MGFSSHLPPITVPPVGIVEFLFNTGNSVPDTHPVLIEALTDKTITFGELKDSVLRVAAGLQDLFHIKHGDTTAVYAPNQVDYIIPLLATLAAGGTATLANPAYSPEELAYQLQDTKAKVLFVHSENLSDALRAADLVGLPKEAIFLFGDQSEQGIVPYREKLLVDRKAVPVALTGEEAANTTAFLCYSSGTTGKSKGVMTTHANVIANVLQYDAVERPSLESKNARRLGVLPFFHIFGLVPVLHGSIFQGVPLYVLPHFDFPRFCESVQRHKISDACVVPPIVLLLAKSPLVDKYDLSSIKTLMSGAAPLGAELAREAKKRLPHIILKQGYGLTETSPASCLVPTDGVVDGSVGMLVSNMKAKIVDENGKEVGYNERGELWLHGPNIMKGYFNNPEATAASIDADGYFHTGDVATINKNGYVFIVDRIKELIKYKGFQVPPAELEALLLKSPMVDDCAVIGVYQEEQATEIPRAYIVLKAGVPATPETTAALKKYVSDRTVHYKHVRSIVFIDTIPKSSAGKILRRHLRDLAKKESEPKAKL